MIYVLSYLLLCIRYEDNTIFRRKRPIRLHRLAQLLPGLVDAETEDLLGVCFMVVCHCKIYVVERGIDALSLCAIAHNNNELLLPAGDRRYFLLLTDFFLSFHPPPLLPARYFALLTNNIHLLVPAFLLAGWLAEAAVAATLARQLPTS